MRDLTPPPPLGQGRLRSGPVRHQRPVYADHPAPCGAACPAGEDVQGWLALLRGGDEFGAWRLLTRVNPMPAVHGRVCYHPCETACNRTALDAAVSVHGVERHLGDLAIGRGWTFEPPATRTGHRVLVVGSGPSGLSAAYHLALLGHDVVVRDAGPEPGGMMRYGIPAYRLPRDVLDAEIARIAALGVTLEQGHAVTDLDAERAGFDAVFVAVGAHLSTRVDIPDADAGHVVDAVTFLRDAADGRAHVEGRVAVYGGGNTAMDAARVARRLGADDSVIVYRRTRDRMPAHEEEARDAEAEGITINWLRTITAFRGRELQVEVQELDDAGVPHGTGRFETLTADTVVLALGQRADTAFLEGVPGVEIERGVVRVDRETFATGAPGVFAGGDAVPGERTVTVGVGHGRRAAQAVDAYLRGAHLAPVAAEAPVTLDQLRPWYLGDHARRSQPTLDPATRTAGFAEVVAGLTPDAARFEAQRCLSCGTCFECDGCFGACPEDAIVKLGVGARYRIDLDRCTGCGACVRQCPVHAIDLVPEG